MNNADNDNEQREEPKELEACPAGSVRTDEAPSRSFADGGPGTPGNWRRYSTREPIRRNSATHKSEGCAHTVEVALRGQHEACFRGLFPTPASAILNLAGSRQRVIAALQPRATLAVTFV